MFSPDHQTRRLLAAERQASLRRDALAVKAVGAAGPDAAATGKRRWALRLPSLHFRPHLPHGARMR